MLFKELTAIFCSYMISTKGHFFLSSYCELSIANTTLTLKLSNYITEETQVYLMNIDTKFLKRISKLYPSEYKKDYKS
jgi:hypothetical protein